MELFKKETAIDFMGIRKITGILTILVCIVALACLIKYKLNFGLEFTGGTQIELRFAEAVALENIKQQLETIGLQDLRVQNYGSTEDVLIRIGNTETADEKKLKQQIYNLFNSEKQKVAVRRIEYVGSEVGEQLAEQGGLAVLAAILATMVYIALRFEYRFAISAAVALCHDAIVVLGIFSWLQVEFDLATLAAILAILGYSLNDTIVVFDRVRENLRKVRNKSTAEVMNLSINQTLSRTIMTSWLTLLVVLALLFYGGASLFGFALALSLGIVIGTYSSIYVAGAFAVTLGLSRVDLLPKAKAVLDDLP